MVEKSRRLALLEGIAAGILFGTAAVFIRLLTDINVFSIALWRLIIASAVLTLIILAFKRKLGAKLIRNNFKHFLVLGMLLGTHFILFVSAVKDTTILNATVLVNTTPIFSIIISTFLYRIKPSKLALAGIALLFIGAGIIAYGDASTGETASLIGDLEAMLAAVAEGFYLNYGREKRSRLPLLPTMLFIYLAAAFTVSATTVLTGAIFEFSNSLEMLLILIGLGVLPTAAAHTLYFSSLSNLKSFETASMALLEPLGATLLGVAIFAEIPTPIFVLGAVLLLVGIFSVASGE
ncbi:MAG: DMT family transporter [Candidatus Bathyarchaeota archaeon]|nr:DMT family transporter [Candidatus Bathyarchaeota archaeon]